MPEELEALDTWWHGPTFLKESSENWPNKFLEIVKIPELKPEKVVLFTSTKKIDVINIERFCSFSRLRRITAYCLRFIHNFTCRITKKFELTRTARYLSPRELLEATNCLVRIVQRENFPEEIRILKSKEHLPRSNRLTSLSPFLDNDCLLRVGGRIDKSALSYDQKHQFLLPKHHFTNLVFRDTHIRNLHSGVQLTLSIVRQQFWPIDGKNGVKKEIRKCISCFKVNPKLMGQIMGDLPASRMECLRPFRTTGLDYCGPFSVRYRNQRKDTYNKVYICIFVCFSTKAVHLEVVEDATMDAFIACLKRFYARRGKSAFLWSDNGTNFVGANNKLEDLFHMFKKQNSNIEAFCAENGTNWKFIPPRAPHFGGLWESGVKVLKQHLKRIVGDKIMTLEFLYTLVVEIEGIMNSRPISQLSSDPNDFNPLTPGHFLIGTAINSILEPDVTKRPPNRLSHWQQITHMKQHFWKRFVQEYIHTLQQRKKWKVPEENLKPNELVIVMDDNLPSTHWLMGRIDSVITGDDGKVRCAIIKTKNGIIKRGITKLARLPTE